MGDFASYFRPDVGYTNTIWSSPSVAAKAPQPSASFGKVTVAVVRLKAGWVGQLLVDGEIVHEMKPRKTSWKAEQAAKARVARRVAKSLS